jgi:hypothetical protein
MPSLSRHVNKDDHLVGALLAAPRLGDAAPQRQPCQLCLGESLRAV